MRRLLYVYILLFCIQATTANITKIPAGRLRDDTKPGRLVNASFILTHNKHVFITNPAFRLPTFDSLLPPTDKTWRRFLSRALSMTSNSDLVCTTDGPECASDQFCYNGLGCCQNTQFGCGDDTCCDTGFTCCGSSCCPMGYSCITVNGQTGCCLTGSTCQAQGDVVDTVEGLADVSKGQQCVDPGYGLCPSGDFCCQAGKNCLKDLQGNNACERSCQDPSYNVCPTNNFCCPPGATCYVGTDGSQQCAVFATSTYSSSLSFITPPFSNCSNTTTSLVLSTSTVIVNISYPTQDPSTTTIVLAPSTIEIPIATTVILAPPSIVSSNLSTTSSPTRTTTVGSIQPLSSTTSTSTTGNSMAVSTPTPHNGGLDDIFTNDGLRRESNRIGLLGTVIAALYQFFV